MGKKRDAKKARRKVKAAEAPTPPFVGIDPGAKPRLSGKDASFIIGDEHSRLWPSRAMKDAILGRGVIEFGNGEAFVPIGEARNVRVTIDPGHDPDRKPLPIEITALLKVEKRKPATLIPPDARSAKWEDVHEFHRGATRPSRSSFGLHVPDPPIAMRCPECDVRQAAIFTSRPRSGSPFEEMFGGGGRERWHRCKYCGVSMTAHGTRVLWWR